MTISSAKQRKCINTVNYLTGVFNNSATIYANDGITARELTEIFVWTSDDPLLRRLFICSFVFLPVLSHRF